MTPADRAGRTELRYAAAEERVGEVIRVLLAASAEPDIKNNAGISARDFADRVANNDLKRHLPQND